MLRLLKSLQAQSCLLLTPIHLLGVQHTSDRPNICFVLRVCCLPGPDQQSSLDLHVQQYSVTNSKYLLCAPLIKMSNACTTTSSEQQGKLKEQKNRGLESQEEAG